MGRPKRTEEDRVLMRAAGERLAWARDAQGLSQQEFADLAGVHQTAISQYEKGGRLPDRFELPRFCGKLRISPDYLLKGELQDVERELAIRLASLHPELVPPIDKAQRKGTGKS